jgi:Mg-chelatase subunit ChlD
MLKRGKRKKAEKNNKGLSSIIVTLIIVTISLVAITSVGLIVNNIIKSNAELAEIQSQFLNENIEINSVKVDFSHVNMTLERKSGELKTVELNITRTEKPADVDIFSVVDLSLSMSSDKLVPLQNANKDLITKLLSAGDNRIGLVAYRGSVIESLSANLTKSSSVLNTIIDSWTASDYTCICCGINSAVDRLMAQSVVSKSKAIIVMSDGQANKECLRQNTHNPSSDAIHAACDGSAILQNLKIWSIGVGTDADTATLTAIANCGGGQYFPVADASNLIQTYETIISEIKTTFDESNAVNYISIVFSTSTESYKEKLYDIPGVLQSKLYSFDLSDKLSGEIIKIEIYPVIITSSKKEVVGPLMSSWKKS